MFGDCSKLIRPYSQTRRESAKQGKISAVIGNNAFPHPEKGKQEKGVFKWLPTQNKIILCA